MGSSGINAATNEKKKKRKLRATPKETKHKNGHKRRKLNNDNDGTKGQNLNCDSSPLEIRLPTLLKKKLINDWEQITKKQLTLCLPRKEGFRISDILSDFESFA